MPADVLATSGAGASAGMVLTPQSQNIPSPKSEELIQCEDLFYIEVPTFLFGIIPPHFAEHT